jgi:hypothetical protein
MKNEKGFWKATWWAATLFNFAIGLPITAFNAKTFAWAYGPSGPSADPMALRLWRDFGILVMLIGIGYGIVASDVTKNRGIVYLGIGAKLFDVITLTGRNLAGLAAPIVLLPAAIDGLFVLLFIAFLVRTAPAKRLD